MGPGFAGSGPAVAAGGCGPRDRSVTHQTTIGIAAQPFQIVICQSRRFTRKIEQQIWKKTPKILKMIIYPLSSRHLLIFALASGKPHDKKVSKTYTIDALGKAILAKLTIFTILTSPLIMYYIFHRIYGCSRY